MTIEEYIANKPNWSVYHSSDKDSQDPFSTFDKYLYVKHDFLTHDDYNDVDIFTDTNICLYRYYYKNLNCFEWVISIYKSTPGSSEGRLSFCQTLNQNEELTAEYLESLRKIFKV